MANPKLLKWVQTQCPACHGTGITGQQRFAGVDPPSCQTCNGFGRIKRAHPRTYPELKHQAECKAVFLGRLFV